MGNQWTDSMEAVHENRVVQVSDPVYVTYASGGTTLALADRHLMCTVPAHSLILAVYYRRAVAFNAGTNDYLTVGTYADDDLLVNDADVSSAAATIPVVVNTTTLPYWVDADSPIYATYLYSGTAPTAGAMEVSITWVPWTIRDEKTVSGGS